MRELTRQPLQQGTTGNKREASRDAVVSECELGAAPERVWRALTEPELLAKWLLPNDIRPLRGARFTLQGPPGTPDGRVECEILEAQPNRLLQYRWRIAADGSEAAAGPPLDSTVTFELFPTITGGTLLRVIHAGFAAAIPHSIASQTRASTACASAGLRWAA
ncbi:MAG TPA: SRPBCC domain-containing protein [Steroidobacteraceae bacterium]|nr:SRPBCC domain-containing protein [Steroidobacteraceae bacterium]